VWESPFGSPGESDSTASVIVMEKRLLGFQAVYGEWIDRAAKHAKLAVDAGAMRAPRSLIKAILGDLGLNQKQQSEAPAIVRRHLLALAG
jgi:hypothetical protein